MTFARPPGALGTPVLTCDDLAYSYGDRPAVAGLTFAVRPGEAYGLLGPNGAGKTTTIRLVCGIAEPDAGVVRIGGQRVTGAAGRRARAALGYVPQEIALFPTLTLGENLAFWAAAQGVPAPAGGPGSPRRSTWSAWPTGPVTGSSAARAGCNGESTWRSPCCTGPALVVLDEPTVGVDAQSRAAVLATLRRPPRRRVRPSSTRATTWTRSSGSATGSASSTRAGCTC